MCKWPRLTWAVDTVFNYLRSCGFGFLRPWFGQFEGQLDKFSKDESMAKLLCKQGWLSKVGKIAQDIQFISRSSR